MRDVTVTLWHGRRIEVESQL